MVMFDVYEALIAQGYSPQEVRNMGVMPLTAAEKALQKAGQPHRPWP